MKTSLVSIVSSSVPLTMISGCGGSFWKTDFIEQNTEEVFKRRESIEQRYKKDSGVEILKHPKKLKKPTITKNPDNTYTLFYECQFIEGSKLEKIVQEQVEGATISSASGTNQLIVKVKEESDISYLMKLLNKTDKMPSQVLLKLNIYNDYGDHTQDFATHLEFLRDKPGFTSSATADYPGASIRVKGREDIGTKYGFGYEDSTFTMKAILDVLESKGYVKHLYQTEMLLSNGEKGSLEGKETLPIPNWIVAGQTVVQTYELIDIRSFFEATPTIYEDGLVQLSFTAGIGSSKRPEGPIQWPVPVTDQVTISNVYLRVGQPFFVAGKVNELEVGVVRKDPILFFFPRGKDWEKRVSRVYYEVTPFRVRYYIEEESELKDLDYNVEILSPNIISNEKLSEN